jgi:hypothetical protein
MARTGSGLRDDYGFHLYAVVDALPSSWRPPAQGVSGRPVLAWQVEPWAVVASPVLGAQSPTPATLAQHHDVIGSLLDARGVLPLPFGPTLPESGLMGWLQTHRERIRAGLDEVRGAVEMTVRLVRLEPGLPTTSAATLRAFGERLVERAAVSRWRYAPSGRGGNLGATLAFLVPRDEMQDFLARIAPLASRATGLAVVPSGPWAPYSFAPTLEVGPGAGLPDLVPVARAG